MPRTVPHPEDLFAPGRRHLFVFAHQDDELPYAGLIQRAMYGPPGSSGSDVRLLWVTNGDGLAPSVGEPLDTYAAKRERESRAAAATLGVPEDRLRFLRYSEVEIYDWFAGMVTGGERVVADAWPHFQRIAADVEREVRAARADVVWTLAYQGGHPEHDLTHLCVARAMRRLLAAGVPGETPPLYELPAYELTILVPLRFRPWLNGVQHAIQLNDDEYACKLAVAETYPSQAELLRQFQRVIGVVDRARSPLSLLSGKPRDGLRAWLERETFRRVDLGQDYTRPPYALGPLNYLFERHQGTPVRWRQTIRPIARLLGLG